LVINFNNINVFGLGEEGANNDASGDESGEDNDEEEDGGDDEEDGGDDDEEEDGGDDDEEDGGDSDDDSDEGSSSSGSSKSVNPSNLLNSAEWSQVIFPVQSYINGNKCIRIDSFETKEPIGFCFESIDDLNEFGQAIENMIKCRRGIPIRNPFEDAENELENGLQRLAKYYVDENNSTAAVYDVLCLDCA